MTAPPPRDESNSVAALFVYADGIYADVPDVEIWDEKRDARRYPGPHPVVAHPPCKVWSIMANCRPEIVKGEDGGCFEAALNAVRAYGGVLEHPAHTSAWKRFGLPEPPALGWGRSLTDPGWVCEVDQRNYGHEANKPTWLYFVGSVPPAMRWFRGPKGVKTVGRSWGGGRDKGRSGTPLAFRDVLLDMARSAVRRPKVPLSDPTYLESWRITPTCRERGVDVAWEDAVARLRKVYDVQLARFGNEPGLVLTVSIARTRDMSYRPDRRS